MTDEKIFRRTIRPTHQWGIEASVKTLFCFLDCLNPYQKTRHLFPAGVPISSMRPRNQTSTADSGTEECVYCKASDRLDSASQTTSQINRRITERSGDASLRRISQKAKAWLRRLIERFKCNISLIDHFSARFLKFIVCWFPKDSWEILRKKYV